LSEILCAPSDINVSLPPTKAEEQARMMQGRDGQSGKGGDSCKATGNMLVAND
jgi:hypothetical protein